MISRLTFVLVAAFAVAACSNDLSRAEAVESFQVANPGASIAEATCVIDALIEEYEGEPVDEAALAGVEAELLAEPQSERFLLDQFRATFGCGMTDGVEAQLRRELLANDINESAVDCVAKALAGRLTDADLGVLIGAGQDGADQDGADDLSSEASSSFYASFFAAVEGCDALPS